MSQRLTAALASRGYAPTWDETGQFQGIRPLSQGELSQSALAGIGATNARAGEATAHANYLDQLPDLRRELESARDNTMVRIQQMRSQDKELDRALSSQLAGDKQAQQLYLQGMGWLERERMLAERDNYTSFGKDPQSGKAMFDQMYQGEVGRLTAQLKANTHGSGPAPSTSFKQQKTYLGHTYGRNSNSDPWTLIK